MKVRNAKAVAKQWVTEYAAQLPGFCGAYLAGGINRIPDEESFPAYIDVDVHVLLNHPEEQEQPQLKFLYDNVLIESVYLDRSEYESPEAVLSDPLEAHNFLSPCVLSDPTGSLTQIQPVVAQEFARRQWVEARCGKIRRQIMDTLDDKEKSSSRFPVMMLLILHIPNLIANANLKPATFRRAFCQMREALHAVNRQELYESILALYGFVQVSREKAELCLQECLRAFDRAVEVFRTPFPLDFQIHPYVRPYILDGAQEIIYAGLHREAMLWIIFNHRVANMALQNDAAEEEKAQFQEAYDRLYARSNTWYGKRDAWPTEADILPIRRITEELFAYVDEVVASHPEIGA